MTQVTIIYLKMQPPPAGGAAGGAGAPRVAHALVPAVPGGILTQADLDAIRSHLNGKEALCSSEASAAACWHFLTCGAAQPCSARHPWLYPL